MSTILYIPISQDELTPVILALDKGIDRLETRTFREDAKQVRERLVNLLLMSSHKEEEQEEPMREIAREEIQQSMADITKQVGERLAQEIRMNGRRA